MSTKLLWHSNAPWAPTGYGNQTQLFTPQLADHYDLAISSFYGLDGAPLTWEGIPVLPGMSGEFGNHSLPAHAVEFFGDDPRGGLVVTLMDVWVLDAAMAAGLNIAAWCPVDHEPAPPGVLNFFLKSGAVPLAMSQFGMRLLGRLDPLYVPHAVDTEGFKPYQQAQVRKQLGIPEDVFLVGMVAANKGHAPSRKSFSEALQAFKMLRTKHDNAVLYLHTTLPSGYAQGEDLEKLIDSLDIPESAIKKADSYHMIYKPYPQAVMARLYSSMDVLLNPAMGEGFGIPVLEAQACGTPAIVTDFSAMTEVCGAGWHVESTRFWTGQNSWQASPSVPDIYEALEDCHAQSSVEKAKMRATARAHALNYSLPRVLKQHMLPALRIAEQRFRDRDAVTIKPRTLKAAA